MSRFFAGADAFLPSLLLLIFFAVFIAILFWLYHPRNKEKFESYGKIPFKEDQDDEKKD
ncbi:MAG: cbb3-type cytochrome c oxidase subunit 3 [Micavibrio sp.]|nr:MAG: cbb3-type cytochrome c oxidase subunit 3 [Micavibrio sp.]